MDPVTKAVDLNLLGFHVPVAWFNSIDSFVSILAVPFLFALWRWPTPSMAASQDEIGKIAAAFMSRRRQPQSWRSAV